MGNDKWYMVINYYLCQCIATVACLNQEINDADE